MRDHADNVVVVCSIENLDPMGVHTGDSITVAPALTLTDREYQRLRDIGIAIIREVGVDTGGCNIQFAVNPVDGRIIVIEMNPRVSRSSALASKATGFPIAKIAAKMAIGYTLDEVPNDITRETPASFEPTLDYVVVKVPRFAFEKFPAADPTLTTTMKSVGEAMAIGRNFTEALQKALRSMERSGATFHWDGPTPSDPRQAGRAARGGRRRRPTGASSRCSRRCAAGPPSSRCTRPPASTRGSSTRSRSSTTWPTEVAAAPELTPALLRLAKRHGFSDAPARRAAPVCRRRSCAACATPSGCVRSTRPSTPAPPSSPRARPTTTRTYDEETEVRPRERPAVIILGSGPNRIGQGVEFDYSCVHASFALRDAGFDTVMVNCNPETVSTDYDTSSRLYFEPLTLEDVLEVVHAEAQAGPIAGVIVQLGGQTPLGLAQALKDEGVPIVGTSPEAINLAEDRGAFGRVLAEAGLPAPRTAPPTAPTRPWPSPARSATPCSCAPPTCSAGAAWRSSTTTSPSSSYVERATVASPEHPVLVDRFLDDAIEIDVDALYDGDRDVPRRHHGAHRGGRHPLRRQLVHPAAGHPRGERARPGPRVDASSWRRASGCAG